MKSTSARKKSPSGQGPPAPCSACEDLGYVVDESGLLTPCACGLIGRLDTLTRLRQARIPERFVNKTLDSFDVRSPDRKRREALQQLLHSARAYAASFNPREEDKLGLLMRGGTGVGKTHLAIAILREVVLQGCTGLYCNVTELLARLRSTYEDNAEEEESRVIEEYRACDLLVLDDLGSESTTPWVLDRLYLLINSRYESTRPVIVTTNCDENELRQKVGPRIHSRLCEMCRARFPDFPREDYRVKMLE